MSEIEEVFVKTFISRDRRERWLSSLPDQEKRWKALHNLSNSLTSDLDPRFVYDKSNPPSEIAIQIQKVLREWKKANPKQLCHIISHGQMDKKIMSLTDAEADYTLSLGAVIIIIPNKLAYYHTERSNLNKQPFYVLFHPQPVNK